MEFGTLILSKEHGLFSDLKRIDGEYVHAIFPQVGKFIFQRPDNKKLIIEVDKHLFEERVSHVFLLNQANVQHFKAYIHDIYEKKKTEAETEISNLQTEADEYQEKVSELQLNIDSIEAKNAMEFSPNRAKNISGLKKAQRRHQTKLNGVLRKIAEQQSKIAQNQKAEVVSMDYIQKKIEPMIQE